MTKIPNAVSLTNVGSYISQTGLIFVFILVRMEQEVFSMYVCVFFQSTGICNLHAPF